MDRHRWDLTPDSVQRALDILGPRSSGQVVREAFYGTRRFDEFLLRTGLTAPVLSKRLKDLEALDILRRVPYQLPGERTRYEYRLTPQGVDLAVVLVALMAWADRWLPGSAGPTVGLSHRGCGGVVHARLECGSGHHGLVARDVLMAPGPGASERQEPDADR